jgi:hypothetical protein
MTPAETLSRIPDESKMLSNSVLLRERDGSSFVAQACFELLGSNDPPASASRMQRLQVCTKAPGTKCILISLRYKKKTNKITNCA